MAVLIEKVSNWKNLTEDKKNRYRRIIPQFLVDMLKNKRDIRYKKDFLKQRKIYFSQFGEDIIIFNLIKYILNIEEINYIEIGLNQPIYSSNTAMLYLTGSRGVCIEPNTDLLANIKKMRPNDQLLNIGIGKTDTIQRYYRFRNASDLNTFSESEANKLKYDRYCIKDEVNIEIKNINAVFEKYYADKRITFVSIDTEGLDQEIIESIDYNRFSPLVLCYEKRDNEAEIAKFLMQRGYIKYAETKGNCIFVIREALFSVKPKS